MANKKEREIAVVDAIRRKVATFPAGQLDPHEAPDFLLRHDGRVIGVEVTNLYPTDDPSACAIQAQEAERRTIVDSARALAEAEGLPPLLVAVSFLDSAPVRKFDRDDLARSIFALVRQLHPPEFGMVRVGGRHRSDVILPDQVHSLGIHRQPGVTRNSWSSIEADIVSEDFHTVIQARISDKARELTRYLKSCEECWLAIASGLESFRPIYEASAETLAHRYLSPFGRVFYIEGVADRVFELSTRSSESDVSNREHR